MDAELTDEAVFDELEAALMGSMGNVCACAGLLETTRSRLPTMPPPALWIAGSGELSPRCLTPAKGAPEAPRGAAMRNEHLPAWRMSGFRHLLSKLKPAAWSGRVR